MDGYLDAIWATGHAVFLSDIVVAFPVVSWWFRRLAETL